MIIAHARLHHSRCELLLPADPVVATHGESKSDAVAYGTQPKPA
jgi:hypothetical protein